MVTSVAAEGFARLAEEMELAAADAVDAADRLRRTGRAYVRVAAENPGHFAVMMQNGLVRNDNDELLVQSSRAYGVLLDVMRAIREERNPTLDVEAAATFVWSAIQGLVVLSSNLGQVDDETGTSTASIGVIVDRFTTFMLQGFDAR